MTKPCQKFLLPFVLGTSLVMLAPLARAAESPTPIANANLVQAVRKANVLKSEYPVVINLSQTEAIVSTFRNPNQPDNDCKIDAVFVAKAIMEASKDVTRVKVEFAHQGDDMQDVVSVTEGEIKAFGSGTLSEKSLLSSLEIVHKDATEEKVTPVKPGPFEVRRAVAQTRIGVLAKHGTNVAPFQKLFDNMENDVASGAAGKIRTQLDFLDQKLAEQEDLIRQAAKVQSEKPVSGKSTGSNSSPWKRRYSNGPGGQGGGGTDKGQQSLQNPPQRAAMRSQSGSGAEPPPIESDIRKQHMGGWALKLRGEIRQLAKVGVDTSSPTGELRGIQSLVKSDPEQAYSILTKVSNELKGLASSHGIKIDE